ncbi:MAG: YbbR-like domain-containing protein [Bacteroidales bacterium]|nr:YbbR-like domain-containing protein [Bacteroidales bacterium]MDD4821642.1 YbbR-like domain-containing protein [Bacteroidales bacterium]
MDELIKTLIQVGNKVRKFFGSRSFKELLTFLVFVILSFILWFIQNSKDNYEANFEVPISYINLPESYLLTSKPPLYFHVRVEDQGLELLSLASKDFVPVEIDLSKEEMDGSGIHSIFTGMYEEAIRKRFKSTTKILSIGPDNLVLNYAIEKEKVLPVTVNVDVQLESQYTLNGTISAMPSTVKAYGSQQALDTLKEVSTIFFLKEQVKDSLTFKAPLQAPDGIRFVPDFVDVTIPVEAFTETFLELPVTGVNFPKHQRLVTFPSRVRVTYCVVLSKYSKVKESDFTLAIDYNTIMDDQRESIQKIDLLSAPDYIFNVRINPEETECLVEEIPTSELDEEQQKNKGASETKVATAVSANK